MKLDKLRMLGWLMLAGALYLSAVAFKTDAQLSTGLWKAGHVTAGAFLGYWAYRARFGRITPASSDGRIIAAAIVMAACIIGLAFGL